MKRFILIALILLLVANFLSCSDIGDIDETEIEETLEYSYELRDPALFRSQDRYEFFVETSDYDYYLNQEKVYFSAKDDPAFYLLCGKPDCTHNGNDCDAYAGWALGWWDGQLYGVCENNLDYILFSMNTDGSNHNVITNIVEPLGTDGQYGGAYYFFFHNGYLYYYILATPNAFFRVNLSTGETTQLMQDELKDDAAIFELWRFEGDDMYFVFRNAERKRFLYRLCGEDAECICPWNFDAADWEINGDTISFYSTERQSFCEYHIATDTLIEKCSFAATNGAATYDTDYIYLVTWEETGGERTVYLFDRNYQLLDEMQLPLWYDLLYATADKLFFTGMPSCSINYYIPKSAIGTGELELIEVTNPYSYR